jgi:hypothetical protein
MDKFYNNNTPLGIILNFFLYCVIFFIPYIVHICCNVNL